MYSWALVFHFFNLNVVYLYLSFSPPEAVSRCLCYTMLVVGFRKKPPLLCVCSYVAAPKIIERQTYLLLCVLLSLLMRATVWSVRHGLLLSNMDKAKMSKNVITPIFLNLTITFSDVTPGLIWFWISQESLCCCCCVIFTNKHFSF